MKAAHIKCYRKIGSQIVLNFLCKWSHFVLYNSLIQNDFIMLAHQFTILDVARMYHIQWIARKKTKETSRRIYGSTDILSCSGVFFVDVIYRCNCLWRKDGWEMTRGLSSSSNVMSEWPNWMKPKASRLNIRKVPEPSCVCRKVNFLSLKNQFHPLPLIKQSTTSRSYRFLHEKL